jgi:hypothetical protein
MSADRNIDHGDNSCGMASAFSELGVAFDAGAALADDCGAADGGVADDDPAEGDIAEGDTGWAWTGDVAGDGAVCATDGAGLGATAFCCAEANEVSDTTTRVAISESFIRDILNIAAFIPRPSSE